MQRSDVIQFIISFCLSLAFTESLSAQRVPDREVSQLRIEGLMTVSADNIRRALAGLPEIFEASHSSVDQATYVERIRDAVARGMLASGFFDSHVEVQIDGDLLALRVKEGPRFRYGSITISGVSDGIGQWVGRQLLITSDEEEDETPVWETGEPASGTLFGRMNQIHKIQERLTQIGLHGNEAVVDLVRNDDTKSQDLRIALSSTDSSFESPKDIDGLVSSSIESNSHDEPLLDGVGKELQQIHRQWFSEPARGIRFRETSDEMIMELVVGDAVTVAVIQHATHRWNFVIEHGEMLVSMQDPTAAIRLPLPITSALLFLQSVDESEDGSTTRISIGGALSSSNPGRPVETGVVFTEQGWREWFPPDSTERSADKNGVTYSHQDQSLRTDHEGGLVELSGTDANGSRIRIEQVELGDVRKLADEVTQAVEPAELIVRDPNTGHRIKLRDVLQAFTANAANGDTFYIPPAYGDRDLYSAIMLLVVNDAKFVEPDSLIGRLAKLYALELSGRRRGLVERLQEIEAEALGGPITSAVVAELWNLVGKEGRALQRYQHAQSLAKQPTALQHDLKIIVDSKNLFGRLCEETDIKHWLQQSLQLVEPLADEHWVALGQDLLALIPDVSTRKARCEIAEVLLEVAYETCGQQLLEMYLEERIEALQSRQAKIAEQHEADQKQR